MDVAQLQAQLAEADSDAARLAAEHDARKRAKSFKWRIADAEQRATVAAREADQLRAALLLAVGA